MMKCKVKLDSVSLNEDGTAAVVFTPVTSGSIENQEFFHYTPWGKIELGTINRKIVAQLEVGREYYVDFIEAL